MNIQEHFNFLGWESCIRLHNDEVEIIVTSDIGPRIIRYGFLDKKNILKVFEEDAGKTGSDEWHSYGGHRLWHAPEEKPRTYFPDNSPVPYELKSNWLCMKPETETTTGIQKQMDIRLAESGRHVKIIHRLTNHSPWDVTLAPWALTVLNVGGTAIFPREPYIPFEEALYPSNPMTMWTYTIMDDPRWSWGSKFITLRQDTASTYPQKFGYFTRQGWAAYNLDEYLFIKRFNHLENMEYPDFGCNVESFTNHEILEVETLGPLTKLAPGETVDHTEHWCLYDGFNSAWSDEEELQSLISPFIIRSEKDVSI